MRNRRINGERKREGEREGKSFALFRAPVTSPLPPPPPPSPPRPFLLLGCAASSVDCAHVRLARRLGSDCPDGGFPPASSLGPRQVRRDGVSAASRAAPRIDPSAASRRAPARSHGVRRDPSPPSPRAHRSSAAPSSSSAPAANCRPWPVKTQSLRLYMSRLGTGRGDSAWASGTPRPRRLQCARRRARRQPPALFRPARAPARSRSTPLPRGPCGRRHDCCCSRGGSASMRRRVLPLALSRPSRTTRTVDRVPLRGRVLR